jgi:hypothetical protein
MRVLVTILLCAVSSTTVQPHAAQPCLSFEPTVESIVGTLVRKTFAGPPNYESVKAGDEAETGWYVSLARPICVGGTPRDEPNEDVSGVKLVQLVLTHGEYKTHARLVGKTVKATGTFFAAQTGHHYTPVLLQVVSLERTK